LHISQGHSNISDVIISKLRYIE